jgi:hypothetical protein
MSAGVGAAWWPTARAVAVALLLGLVIGAGAARSQAAEPGGNELQVACDEVVRLGVVFSCTVSRTVSSDEAARGPLILQVSLTQSGQPLATAEYPISRLAQLREPCHLNLVPLAAAASAAVVELTVTLTNPQRSAIQRATRSLPTPLGLEHAFADDYRRLLADPAGQGDALPFLWAEQAGEVVESGWSLRSCAALSLYHERLAAWLAGRRQALFPVGCNELALRDPVDGSIQPYRLHLPRSRHQPVPLALLLWSGSGGVRKSAWPLPPAAWLEAAREAGVAVLEPYPAGDLSWSGIAVGRARTAVAECLRLCPGLDAGKLVLVGVGAGARGALSLAEQDPGRCSALALVDPVLSLPADGPGDPAAPAGFEQWLALLAPGGRPAHLAGVPTALCGQADPAGQRWLERLERCGGEVLAHFPSPAVATFWDALASHAVSTPPREYVVVMPGRYGAVSVEAVAEWGVASGLRIESAHPLRLSTVGIRALTPDGDAEVDGRPWRAGAAIPLPAKILGQAQGPLAAFSQRPFAVVIGTIEHAAAAQDNRQLAQDFLAAWAAYAQGRPPVFEDRAVREQDLRGLNLVLIGNSRSNAVLERLVAQAPGFPLRWDARSVFAPGATFLRDQHRAVALAWPHPALDGRLLVVLDGALVRGRQTGAAQAPLNGLPDLVIGGETPGHAPALEKLFGCDWR